MTEENNFFNNIDPYNRFSRNELYNEVENYIASIRNRFDIKKEGVYKQNPQIFPDIDLDKGSAAMELMKYLKKYVETDEFKLGCI